MTLRPATIDELQAALAGGTADRRPLPMLDLTALNRLIEHHPEDLTCAVECGCRFADLQAALACHRQWLPLDPPCADRLTMRDVIEANLSGPRRLGFGTIREYLIGLEAILADGSRIRSGGRVVKNVAGFDLHKLFIGSRGCLGVPVIAHLKLIPLPAQFVSLKATADTPERALQLAAAVRQRLAPVALDISRFNAAENTCTVRLEIAGDSPAVATARECAHVLGFNEPSGPDPEAAFWRDAAGRSACVSVLPSRLGDLLDRLSGRRFIARAGNGIVYHDGPPLEGRPIPPRQLLDRLKKAFDPYGILPPLPE